MSPIPKKLRDEMSNDPFYKRCCVSGVTSEKIDFHHNLIFGNKQVQESFCILPLAKSIHDQITVYKDMCDWIMWSRATPDQIKKYSKAINYQRIFENLKQRFGEYRPL